MHTHQGGILPTAAIFLLGSYQLPSFRVIKRAGTTNMPAYSASLRKAGAISDPMHTIVLPLPAPSDPVSVSAGERLHKPIWSPLVCYLIVSTSHCAKSKPHNMSYLEPWQQGRWHSDGKGAPSSREAGRNSYD